MEHEAPRGQGRRSVRAAVSAIPAMCGRLACNITQRFAMEDSEQSDGAQKDAASAIGSQWTYHTSDMPVSHVVNNKRVWSLGSRRLVSQWSGRD